MCLDTNEPSLTTMEDNVSSLDITMWNQATNFRILLIIRSSKAEMLFSLKIKLEDFKKNEKLKSISEEIIVLAPLTIRQDNEREDVQEANAKASIDNHPIINVPKDVDEQDDVNLQSHQSNLN